MKNKKIYKQVQREIKIGGKGKIEILKITHYKSKKN
jgi:hypothetical protein